MIFQLDDKTEASYNTTASSNSSYAHHQVFWQSGTLEDKQHELVVTQKNNISEDAVICFDFVTYAPSQSAITANTSTLVDDQDEQAIFSPEWQVSSGTINELMMQTGMFSAVQGSMFELEFEGEHVNL